MHDRFEDSAGITPEGSVPLAWLNGRFFPASEAVISPVDAGFVQGTTVAEQLRTFSGRLFHLDDHLIRLRRSLEIVGVDPGLGHEDFAALAQELVARNHRLLAPGDDLGLSIFVTPGLYAGYGGASGVPTVCLHTYPLPFRFWAEKYRTGQALVVTKVQQVPAACWPASLKCRSRMHYYLADRRAAEIDPGARAVLVDREGMITEASTANIVLYREHEGLVTPPRSNILHGISLQVVEQLGLTMGLATHARRFRADEVASADEVFLTSTPFCLLPVTRLDRRPICGGVPGPMFRRLLAAWSAQVGLDIEAQAARFADRR
ncbi:MAG: aminotransferase class IV [Thermoguttaceae bacterium]|jgi:branched-subunit amino acid aminotransferase/4-amino-4-deoxychorismate lyase|nr:aminotransferase class IV [Thermoguttaceae bacterium]